MSTNTIGANSDELEALLTSVAKYRRTVPQQCIELRKEAVNHEVTRLLNSDVKLRKSSDQFDVTFNETVKQLQGLPNVNQLDLQLFEQRLDHCMTKAEEIAHYLATRAQYSNSLEEIPAPDVRKV